MIVVATEPAVVTDVARTLDRLREPVGLLAVGAGVRHERLRRPTIALHAGSIAFGPHSSSLENIFVRERDRADATLSLDLHASLDLHGSLWRNGSPGTRPSGRAARDIEVDRARVHRLIRHAHIVTACADDLALLYPGVPLGTVAAEWREAGVACCAITSARDGAFLLAPNGVAYRRAVSVPAPTDPVLMDPVPMDAAPMDPAQMDPAPMDATDSGGPAAFTAGLLSGLAAIGALGRDPERRLADVRMQQWLAVLDYADTRAAARLNRRG